jgi:hypothetical protein
MAAFRLRNHEDLTISSGGRAPGHDRRPEAQQPDARPLVQPGCVCRPRRESGDAADPPSANPIGTFGNAGVVIFTSITTTQSVGKILSIRGNGNPGI